MPFKAEDLAFQINLDDQQLGFAVQNTPPNGDILAQGAAVTCGPSNPAGAYIVKYNIGFSDKDNFNELKKALSDFLEQMNSIDVS
jgi:hypothetical protein